MPDQIKLSQVCRVFLILALLFSIPRLLSAQQAGPASNVASASIAGASAARSADAPFTALARPRNSTREAMMYMKLYGVEDMHVQETSSGGLLRFSYRVVDANKAKGINDKKNSPILLVEKSSATLEVTTGERVGQLRQVAAPENGREYWMVFGNSSHAAQVGDRVDITIGTFRVKGIVVEPSQAHPAVARKP